jgi:hypothetical protein
MAVVTFRNLTRRLVFAAALLATGAVAQAQDSAGKSAGEADAKIVADEANDAAPTKARLYVTDDEAPGEGGNVVPREIHVRLKNVADPGYWIGLQLEPASAALRRQLGVAEDRGLVVVELFPDTPAVKAGFEKYDLLVQQGDEPVKDIEAFNNVVQETKGERELAITLYRGGKQRIINVTPAKRPRNDANVTLRLANEPGQDELLYEWLPKGVDLNVGRLNEGPMRIDLFHPGVMFDNTVVVFKTTALPKDLSISISRTGDKPAEISVKKGYIKWDVTEKELDKLPEDVRPHVERMLGGPHRFDTRVRALPHVAKAAPLIVTPYRPTPPTPVAPPIAVAPNDVQRQLDVMNKRLEELETMNKVLEDLRKSLDALVKQRAGNGEDEPRE